MQFRKICQANHAEGRTVMNRPHRIMRLETWPRLYLLPLAKLYCSSRLLCSSAATGVGTYLQFPHRSASTECTSLAMPKKSCQNFTLGKTAPSQSITSPSEDRMAASHQGAKSNGSKAAIISPSGPPVSALGPGTVALAG